MIAPGFGEGVCPVVKTINYPHSRGQNNLVENKLDHKRQGAVNSKVSPQTRLNGSLDYRKMIWFSAATRKKKKKTKTAIMIQTAIWFSREPTSTNKWICIHW